MGAGNPTISGETNRNPGPGRLPARQPHSTVWWSQRGSPPPYLLIKMLAHPSVTDKNWPLSDLRVLKGVN